MSDRSFHKLEWEVRRMKANKRGKVKGYRMNCLVAGIDLGDRESLATVLSPYFSLNSGVTS
jgi:hypothetical protein